MESLMVRSFKEGDTQEVIHLVRTVVREVLQEPDAPLRDLVLDLQRIKPHYIDTGGMFFVGVYKGKIIGTVAVLRQDDGVAQLKRMYVTHDFRGKGFGSQSYDAIEACVRIMGLRK